MLLIISFIIILVQKPLIDPPEQIVHRGDPSHVRCWVPGGGPHIQLRWSLRGGSALPHGARDDERGNLAIQQTFAEHEKAYECTAYNPQNPSSSRQTSDPAIIRLHPGLSYFLLVNFFTNY